MVRALSSSQSKPQSQGRETQTNQTNRQMDVTSHCSPFQRGSPAPVTPAPVTPQPPARDLTADTKQSATPALGLSPMVPPSQEPQGQMGLPTKPPARKIPEREAGEPELTAEVSGLRVGKYQRPLVEAIRSSRLAGCAQQCQGHRRRPGTLGPVCSPRLAVCTTCWTRIHLLPILPPLALDKGVVLHHQLWRTRNTQGCKEVAGRDLNTALPSVSPFQQEGPPN